MLGALIGAGSSLIGGAMGNRGRKKEAEKSRQFESAEASKSRRFSERMRNTEWQAGIADMEKAGVNPALAYSQGGASSPMGAKGSGAMADIEDIISPAVSTAQQARRLEEELKNMKQQYFKTRQDSYTGAAQENLIDAQRKESEVRKTGIGLSNQLMMLQIPGARNIAGFEGGPMGARTRTIRSLLQSVFGSGGAFKPFSPGR